jgi:hypothetical protein
LVELEEDIFIAGFHQQVQKEREKAYHDRHIKKKEFKQGDLVLVYDLVLVHQTPSEVQNAMDRAI